MYICMGSWEARYPVGVLWQSAKCKVFFCCCFFVINTSKRTNIRNCLFFEWLIKNLKWFSYLCVLCVRQRRFKSCQTLFLYLNSVTGIFFIHPHYATVDICLCFMYTSLWTHNRNFHVACVIMSWQKLQLSVCGTKSLRALPFVLMIRVIMPSGLTG